MTGPPDLPSPGVVRPFWWHDHEVDEGGWLAGWNPRYARLLVESETPTVRAGLVDTNGDGRELWFGLEMRSPTGEWMSGLDWDDVGTHQPVGRLDVHADVVFGWGTGRPRQRTVVQFDDKNYPVRVARNGWWLLATVRRDDDAT